jgi:hypothetical protein
MHDELRAIAAQQGGAFSVEQALQCGLGKRRVASLIRSGVWTRLRRGVYADTSLLWEDPKARGIAEVGAARLRIKRPTVVSHASALLVHDVALLNAHGVSLTSHEGTPVTHAGVTVSVAALPDDHCHPRVLFGMPTASVARAVVDAARTLPFLDAVVAADSALHRRKTDEVELRRVLDHCIGWAGGLQAQRVVGFADCCSESVLESASRVFFLEQGIEMPASQVWIDAPGFGKVRVDFYWKRYRVIGEADGKSKYQGNDPDVAAERLWMEKRRQEALEDMGFIFVRWGWNDIFVQQMKTKARILAAFARGAQWAS